MPNSKGSRFRASAMLHFRKSTSFFENLLAHKVFGPYIKWR